MESSLLYLDPGGRRQRCTDDLLEDLHLRWLLGELAGEEDSGRILSFFRELETGLPAARFRQAVYADLSMPPLRQAVDRFLAGMQAYRDALASRDMVTRKQCEQKWLLDAARAFCGALSGLAVALDGVPYRSEGLRRFHAALKAETETEAYKTLAADTAACSAAFDAIRYRLEFDGYTLTVRDDGGAGDFCNELAQTFARYGSNSYALPIISMPGAQMCDLELAILAVLMRDHPAAFASLAEFSALHPAFSSRMAERALPELRFYLAGIDFFEVMRLRGWRFCTPVLAEEGPLQLGGLYDLSLAAALPPEAVQPNEFTADTAERMFLVDGPNRSGKTAYLPGGRSGCLPGGAGLSGPLRGGRPARPQRRTHPVCPGGGAGEQLRQTEGGAEPSPRRGGGDAARRGAAAQRPAGLHRQRRRL